MKVKVNVGAVAVLTILLTLFISLGVVLIPSLRISVAKFLISYKNPQGELQSKLGATVLSVSQVAPTTTLNQATSSSMIASVAPAPDVTLPKLYEFKLMRQVDPCKLNTLGAQGYQPIQYGTAGIDPEAGRDADCKNFHVVDTFDWILFMREK